MRTRSGLLSLATAAVVAGCGQQPPADASDEADVFLPIHQPLNGGPAALVGGKLELRNGCLVFDDPFGGSLPLWPPGTTAWLVDGTVVLADQAGVAAISVGGSALFGGGTDYPLQWAEQQVGDIPPQCEVGNYTLINSLEHQEQ